jgi:hypothetical protein
LIYTYVSIRQHTHADLLQGSGVEGRALDIYIRQHTLRMLTCCKAAEWREEPLIYSRVVFPRHKSRMWKQARLQKKEHTSAYVSMRQSGYFRIRSRRGCKQAYVSIHVRILCQDMCVYVRIRQRTKQTRLHKSIRQHTSAYVSMREDTKQARLQKKKHT